VGGVVTLQVHVGLTGTRNGLSRVQGVVLSNWLERGGKNTVLHHGDCVGADEMAHIYARRAGAYIVIHPPTNDRLRAWCQADEYRKPFTYLTRNRHLVEECQVLWAFPKEPVEVVRSGTCATVRYARKVGRAVRIVYPDGTLDTIPADESKHWLLPGHKPWETPRSSPPPIQP